MKNQMGEISRAHTAEIDQQNLDIRNRGRQLVMEVWDGQHTFASLSEIINT